MDAPYSLKRHHPHPPPPSVPPPPTPKPSSSSGEITFRILCPASKAGGVIGKGGAVIRQLREETGSRIRVVDEGIPPHCDERVILIVAQNSDSSHPNPNSGEETSAAQVALVKVFERMLKVDEERGAEERREIGNGTEGSGFVVCRLLAPSNQVGSVLGRGGKIVEKIRQDSGARVRVLPRENLPGCASPGDELIQITGNVQAVKKALLFVSSCLQEHPKADMLQGSNVAGQMDSFPQMGPPTADHHSRGFMSPPAPESIGSNHRMVPEEDVVFRLLCPADKIGSLIGKGGSIIRVIQNESGASIKIGDALAHDSDERVVVISARESLDLKRSPAQDAVIRVHTRVAEVAFEPGAAVVARLLVHSQQIGCLLGKGGLIVAEMRRLTGANIRIFGREHGLKLSTNDEVVQVIGNLQSVQDALFQITSRLREVMFPRPHLSHVSGSSYMSAYPELPSPSFRPRHDQASPGHYHSPVGLPHGYGYDSRSAGPGQDPPAFSHGTDRCSGANIEQDRHRYGADRASYGPPFERPHSPGAWHPQAVNSGNPARFSEKGHGSSGMVASSNESGQLPVMKSVEVVIPQILLPHVYGENRTNLGHIKQFSGADVVIHDPKPGATEGLIVISGTPSQLHAAQSLVHAFILCGQAF